MTQGRIRNYKDEIFFEIKTPSTEWGLEASYPLSDNLHGRGQLVHLNVLNHILRWQMMDIPFHFE